MLARKVRPAVAKGTLAAALALGLPAWALAPPAPPSDALSPEGRTRWDLGALPESLLSPAPLPANLVHALRPGESRSVSTPTLVARAEGRGVGWALLPSGPREVSLLRAVVEAGPEAGAASAMTRHGYLWVDGGPRVVAAIWWEGAEGDWSAVPEAAAYAPDGVADLRIYSTEIATGAYHDVSYGFDRGKGTLVSALTAAGHATAGEVVAASSWDFSVNTTGTLVAESQAELSAAETCNVGRCGYVPAPGRSLVRTDASFDDPPNLRKDNQSVELDTSDPTKVVLWLRAGHQNEGKTGAFGSGESGYCFTSEGSETRSSVPVYVFGHQDAKGFYFAPGDSWSGGPFNCEQNVFNQTCGVPNLFDELYAKACGTHTGTQGGSAIKNGVVKVPSGHYFNAMLVKIFADFCVYLGSSCSSLGKVDEVRTINYQWMVPHLGTVARFRSPQNVPDDSSWTTVDETNVKFGLYPPLSVTVTGQTDTTVSLRWDPGAFPGQIDRYRIYWDTDSGGASAYAFDSQANPGQVDFDGTSATIGGLSPNTTYYVTVTSISDLTNPSTSVTRAYESLVYPTQVYGDPDRAYPVEVVAVTTGGSGCVPTTEVDGLTVRRLPSGTLEFCWDLATDGCLIGYRLLGSPSASSAGGWAPVADVGPVTCWQGTPAQAFFLVIARGGAGTGPWGHYGQ